MLKIGINGFGRIGRMVLRAYFENIDNYDNIKIIAVNDICDIDTNIHLLQYDSIHGKFQKNVTKTTDGFSIENTAIKVTSQQNPEEIPWGDIGVDIVFECSGRFVNKCDASKHLSGGAKRVIISAPSADADITVVYGINHKNITNNHLVISNGSCTTNCLAPIAYLLDKNFGINCGYMTTIHSYTGDQRLLDTAHKDQRRARAATLSMIPSSTGAARAIGLVLPNLAGKIEGTAIRVPTSNVSLVDLKCLLDNETTEENVNNIMKNSASGELRNVLGFSDKQLVSCDFNHSTESSIFDATGTKIVNKKFCRVTSWYDNEFGFSNRMLDLAAYLAN